MKIHEIFILCLLLTSIAASSSTPKSTNRRGLEGVKLNCCSVLQYPMVFVKKHEVCTLFHAAPSIVLLGIYF